MTGTGVFGAARILVLALLLASIAPTAASAVTAPGGLRQLPAPNDCVSSAAASGCGTTVSGGLGSARSVAVNPGGANAYVASSDGSLSTFGRNGETGALSFTSCAKDPSSTETCASNSTVPLAQAAWVVATDDFVYAASRTGNAISEFARDAGTGQLTEIGCIRQGGGNSAGGTPCDTSPGLAGVDRLALSDDGNLYAVSPSSSTLVTLKIGSGNGKLSAVSCLRGTASTAAGCTSAPGLNGANAVDVAPDNLSVYVTATSGGANNASYLTSYTRDATTGAAAQDQCFHSSGALSDPDVAAAPCSATPSPVIGLNGADGVRTSPDDKNLYVAAGASAGTLGNALVTFNRDTSNGDLSSTRCVRDSNSTEPCAATATGLKGAFDIALTPDGQFLYATAKAGNDVAEFSRDTGTGDLIQLAGNDKCIADGGTECTGNNAAKGLTGASGIALSPNGLFAYVAAPTDHAVSAFTVERPPTCADVGPITTPNNQPVTFTLPCTDPNPNDALTCTTSNPPHGTITPDSPGSCTVEYSPDLDYAGADSFDYHATDSAGQDSNIATATLTVAPASTRTITISDATVDESAGTMTFQLTLSSSAPVLVNVTYSTRDSSAVAPGDYTATSSGTATFAANQTTTTITVPIVNDSVHEATEHFFVDLEASSPSTAIGRPTATGTIVDNDATSIGIGDATVSESAGTANFTVTLSNPSASTVTATYATANGSATSPSDFTAQSNKTVSFAPGETSKQISIPVANDNIPEQTEQFTVNLSAPIGGATAGDSQGLGTIQDEDKPTISVSDTAVAEGDSSTRNAAFTVSLSAPISRTVTVNFATANGSASAAVDYDSGTGVLTFAPGQTSKTVNVAVNGDTSPESDETFTLNLSGPTEATIADGTGAGTILDDDTVATQGGLSISSTSVTEGNAGTRAATFTVSLSQPAAGAVTVDYDTNDGSALAASDYNTSTGTLTFAPGQTSKSVSVEINGDRTFEADETFTVKLSNASGAPISSGTGTGTIVNDDARPRVRASGLRFGVTPTRDRTRPYRFTAKGKLLRPAGMSAADGCRGRVRIRYSQPVGGRIVWSRTARVRANCTYRLVTVLRSRRLIPANGKLLVKPRFLGNSRLFPLSARSKRVRAG
ncbi:MAG: hypothetical protein QOH76_1407 [Thermoleophilaceae bacterium]|nr:hypothetical protein [Thermoleophilaceae bacterium]